MGTTIIHISDIHYRPGWPENHGMVLKAFFLDLEKHVQKFIANTFYIIISGDIVQAGKNQEAYESFLQTCDPAFDKLGIPKGRRICLPGNHDISRSKLEKSLLDHEGIVKQQLQETALNEYFQNCNPVFHEKFCHYKVFESNFSDMPVLADSVAGCGYQLNDDIGIYCLNSALLSSGGLAGPDKESFYDKKRLGVVTRDLNLWLNDTNTACKILVMHHPLNWLSDWAAKEIKTLLKKEFSLFLTGHAHDQEAYHSINRDNLLVELSAPPLFTQKSDTLGYALINIPSGKTHVSEVIYRQWTKHQNFVPGVNFTGTEDGVIHVAQSCFSGMKGQNNTFDVVDNFLSNELREALTAFSSQPDVWVEPIISDKSEREINASEGQQYRVSDLVSTPYSTIIKAPGQFGLSCLARYLVQEAWRSTPCRRWVCLDARRLKSSKNFVKRYVTSELNKTGQKLEDVRCVVLDSWRAGDKNAVYILKAVCEVFEEIPVFVMQTLDAQAPLSPVDDESVKRDFRVLYLWSLSRENVRSVVVTYNAERHIGDENAIISRVISDIDTLNIHRTPLNCLTVLKASEADFDDNPVNRTEVLHRVLYILFNLDIVPTYKTRPDMKDCEHVLGYFAEILIKNDQYVFSREKFLDLLSSFCTDQVIDIDVSVLFDILYDARILVSFGSQYCLKFTYWLYYFAAHRMHHDRNFAEFILSDQRYARFPEIVEFYTGIDRQREDAVNILARDLSLGIKAVHERCGLPDSLNPYPTLEWRPSKNGFQKMEAELRDGVEASNLPDVIKDRYADRDYDRTRPYHQSVRDILTGHTMSSLMLSISAASRALRNSDYVHPKHRKNLLLMILQGWRQISKVLWVLLPLLVDRGHATFDDANFILASDFGDEPDERFRAVLAAIPYNVVKWYQDDLFSPKMASLLTQEMEHQTDDVIKHTLALFQIAKRPKGWRSNIEEYIHSIHKNSFYLGDLHNKLREEYMYSFASNKDLKDLEFLIKMSMTKHIHGVKKPSPKAVKKVPNSVLPQRPKP